MSSPRDAHLSDIVLSSAAADLLLDDDESVYSMTSLTHSFAAHETTSWDLSRTWYLRYNSEQTEQLYSKFVHGKPVMALTVLYLVGTIGLALMGLALDGFETIGFTMAGFYAVCLGVDLMVHFMFKRSPRYASELLMTQRFVQVAFVVFTAMIDLVIHFGLYHTECRTHESIEFQSSGEYYAPAQCSRWWSPIAAASVNILVSYHICTFPMILASCVIIAAGHVIIPFTSSELSPPDPVHQIWLFALYSVGGMLLICFFGYDHEVTLRAQFKEWLNLEVALAQLRRDRVNLFEHGASLVPLDVLKRAWVSDSRSTDTSPTGTAAVVGIHGFDTWCTSDLPTMIVATIARIHQHIRTLADECEMMVVTSMGDTVVAVSGLMNESLMSSARTGRFAVNVALASRKFKCPPIRCAAHVGKLHGAMDSARGLRYTVWGEALDAAHEAFYECGPAEALLSHAILDRSAGTVVAANGDVRMTSSSGAEFVLATENMSSIGSVNLGSPKSGSSGGSRPGMLLSALRQLETIRYHRATESDQHSMQSRVKVEAQAEVSAVDAVAAKKTTLGTVWCCFLTFEDPEVEAAFVEDRVGALPHAASRAWRAYALYLTMLLLLMVVDLPVPRGTAAMVLMLLAIAVSIGLSVAPTMVTAARMKSFFTPWSAVGIVVPLISLYACALARPASVGNDIRLYIVIGAMIRSYCFASSRWQAVIVPIMVIAALGQYALPGAFLRESIIVTWIYVWLTVLAEKRRETAHRETFRRRMQLSLAKRQEEALANYRDALLRHSLPPRAYDRIVGEHKLSGTAAFEVVSIPVCAVMCFTVTDTASRDDLLDARLQLVEATKHLSVTAIQGDQALIVGPIVVNEKQLAESIRDAEAALAESISVGFELVEGGGCHALMEFDSTVQGVHEGSFSSFVNLGAATARVMVISNGVASGVLTGLNATNRVVRVVEADAELSALAEATALGPIKVRGSGFQRLSHLRRR